MYAYVRSRDADLLLLLLLFLNFSVLVANPKKLLYMVANPARGLLNREKRTKEKVWQHNPPPPPTLLVQRREIKNHATHLQALRRSRSVSRPYYTCDESLGVPLSSVLL